MISLDSILPTLTVIYVLTVLVGLLNALLLLRVLRTLTRRDQAEDETARRRGRYAYAAHLLGQMRSHRRPTPGAATAPPTMIDLAEDVSWRRR